MTKKEDAIAFASAVWECIEAKYGDKIPHDIPRGLLQNIFSKCNYKLKNRKKLISNSKIRNILKADSIAGLNERNKRLYHGMRIYNQGAVNAFPLEKRYMFVIYNGDELNVACVLHMTLFVTNDHKLLSRRKNTFLNDTKKRARACKAIGIDPLEDKRQLEMEAEAVYINTKLELLAKEASKDRNIDISTTSHLYIDLRDSDMEQSMEENYDDEEDYDEREAA